MVERRVDATDLHLTEGVAEALKVEPGSDDTPGMRMADLKTRKLPQSID